MVVEKRRSDGSGARRIDARSEQLPKSWCLRTGIVPKATVFMSVFVAVCFCSATDSFARPCRQWPLACALRSLSYCAPLHPNQTGAWHIHRLGGSRRHTASLALSLVRGSVFSFIVQGLGVAVAAVGMAAVWSTSLIFQLFSQNLAWIFICVGLALLVVSLLGCSGAGLHVGPSSCFWRPWCLFRCSRRRSLLLATLFTCVVGAVLASCFSAVRVYENELATAGTNITSRNSTRPDGQDALAEPTAGRTFSSFGKQVVKGAFVHAYGACRPTVYNSTMLNSARYCGGGSNTATTTTTVTTWNSTTASTTTASTASATTTVTTTTAAGADVDYGKYCGRPSQVGDESLCFRMCMCMRICMLFACPCACRVLVYVAGW